MTADSAEAKALIATLVAHHVAVTSTLPVFERVFAGLCAICRPGNWR